MDDNLILKSDKEMDFPWDDKKRFNSYSAYMKRLFGERVQKLSINAGFSCPNRDGSKGKGGCTFCNNDAFNPSYCSPEKSINRQIEEGIEFHKRRYRRANGYLAYFQAYSNTFSDKETLEKIYREALDCDEVIGIVIGTRPDCVDDDKIGLLKKLSVDHHVFVEYGVESCNDNTLERVNRCHTFADSVNAIEKSVASGLHTSAHFIFGLPGENREEMRNSAGIISSLPLDSVKFHQLQIIKGTTMEREFFEYPDSFEIFGFEEYVEFFIDFLEHLDPSIVVERFTSEAPPHLVLAPKWGKKRNDEVVRYFEKRLEERSTWQGRLFNVKN